MFLVNILDFNNFIKQNLSEFNDQAILLIGSIFEEIVKTYKCEAIAWTSSGLLELVQFLLLSHQVC